MIQALLDLELRSRRSLEGNAAVFVALLLKLFDGAPLLWVSFLHDLVLGATGVLGSIVLLHLKVKGIRLRE